MDSIGGTGEMTLQNTAKIAIVGTGAMGSVYAALMKDAGHDVWAVDTWAEHIDAINAGGLRVQGASGDRTVALPATTRAEEVGQADLVIIATKFMDVADAARSILPILRDDTAVLSIQNGLGGPDQAVGVLGADRVTMGVVGGFGASMKAPGHAHHNGMEMVRFGEHTGGLWARTAWIAEIWESAGFKVSTFEDIHKMVWEKLVFNCAMNGPCAVTGMTVGEVLANPDASAIAEACATETVAVAKAKGIAVDIDDPVAYIRAFGAKLSAGRPSLAQDHAARKLSEIDAINGAIPREAAAVGMTAPMNAFVAHVIRARESLF